MLTLSVFAGNTPERRKEEKACLRRSQGRSRRRKKREKRKRKKRNGK
jgi:hypothetical protein